MSDVVHGPAFERLVAEIDLVDLGEIARRLGVGPKTPAQWRHRRSFPDPDLTLTIGDLWVWANIEAWARETGRLP